MSTVERLKEWLAKSLEISETSITPQSTLEGLFRCSQKTYSTEVQWAFVMAFEKEFPGTDGEFLTQNTTIQQMVELIDSSETGHDSASTAHVAQHGGGDQVEPTQRPTIRVFEYIPELDAFLITAEFQRLAAYLGLIEWHAAVWIGRLFMLDNDYGEHWFDNWDEREVLEERARELGIDSYDLMIINPDRLASGGDGPCHSRKQRKRFWTDVLKSLELGCELLFEEARHRKARTIEFNKQYSEGHPYVEDLEERIRQIREGQEIPPVDQAQKSRLHGWVAATVALLATFLTIGQVKDGNIVQAMQQAQASSIDQWSWYQFRKVRSELFQATVDQLRLQSLSAPAAVRPAYTRQIAAYQRQVKEQDTKMRETQAQAEASDKQYNTLNSHDDQFDLSEASLSLAIALLALTALTNKRWLYAIAMVPTTLGVLMGLAGLFNWNLRVDALMRLLS